VARQKPIWAAPPPKRTPAIWERDRRSEVKVRVEQLPAAEEKRPDDWRRQAWYGLTAALLLEGSAAWALGSKGVAGVAAAGLVADLVLWWRSEHTLGMRTVSVLHDLKVGKGLKFAPRLKREEQLNPWVTELYFECPPGLTDVKLAEHSRAISQALNATVMDCSFDDESGWVVLKLGAGRIPKQLWYDDFVRRYAAPPGELVVPQWIGRDGPRWLDLAEAHWLITGKTQYGKSNLLRVWLTYLVLHTDVQLRLIDMKGGVEFEPFRNLPNLGGHGIACTTNQAARLLREVTEELDQREQLFAAEDVNSFAAYNAKHPERRLPYILVIEDEVHRMAKETAPAGTTERRVRTEIEGYRIRILAQSASSGMRVIESTQLGNVQVLPALVREQLVEAHLGFAAGTEGSARVPGMAAMAKLRRPGQAVLARGGEESTGQVPELKRERAEELLSGRASAVEATSEPPQFEVVSQDEEPQEVAGA
jgi:hypothetical protein